jgi:hypothetical protein
MDIYRNGNSINNIFFNSIMGGEEIIKTLRSIREDVSNVDLKKAMLKIDYLIDDIYMYKSQSL